MEFARPNGLSNRDCEMIMKDEKGRSWPLRLKHDTSHVCITRGFHNFLTANGLKEGDSFIIHLLHNGYQPLMNFLSNPKGLNQIRKRKQKECKFGVEDKATKCSRKTTTATTHHHHDGGGHPYFSSTLAPYNIKSNTLVSS